jgi:hypothetical protein
MDRLENDFERNAKWLLMEYENGLLSLKQIEKQIEKKMNKKIEILKVLRQSKIYVENEKQKTKNEME